MNLFEYEKFYSKLELISMTEQNFFMDMSIGVAVLSAVGIIASMTIKTFNLNNLFFLPFILVVFLFFPTQPLNYTSVSSSELNNLIETMDQKGYETLLITKDESLKIDDSKIMIVNK